jgi:hypothetical protein
LGGVLSLEYGLEGTNPWSLVTNWL